MRFEVEQMLDAELRRGLSGRRRRGGCRQDDLLRLLAADRVAEPMAHEPEIVLHLGLELQLFDRRDLDIVGRLRSSPRSPGGSGSH